MTIEESTQIKGTQKWPNKFSDFYKYYFFLVFPLGIVLIGFSELYSVYKFNHQDIFLSGFIITAIGLLLFTFVLLRIKQSSKFDRVFIPGLTVDVVKVFLKNCDIKDMSYSKKGYFTYVTKISAFSWGEEVTILFDNDYILINSRPKSQPITLFKDKKNIKKLIEELNKATQSDIFDS